MRIMYLARRPIPSLNANSVQIVKMCEAFANIGHQVTLVVQRGRAPAKTLFERYGVSRCFDVVALPRGARRVLPKWRFLAELRLFLFRHRADVYFGRDIWSLALVSRLGKPLVYEAHVIPQSDNVRTRLLRWLFSRPNFSHLVCVTSTLAEMYKARFPELEGKPVIVAPNAAAEPMGGTRRRNWPGRAGCLQVGFVGRPYRGKGIEALVEAARHLRSIDVHIIGATRKELAWLDTPIPSNVHFHGFRPHADLVGFYKRFDVAVAPYGPKVLNASSQESAAITSPLKLIEYMASGLPIVVSDLPGVRDMIAARDVAILIPPGDTDALVAALKRLKNPALRERMGAAARQEYLERHTAEARAHKVLAPITAAASCADATTRN